MERFLFQFILLSPDGGKVDFQECHIHNSLSSAKEALINFDLEKYGSFDTIDGEGTCNEHIRLFKWEGEEAKPTYRDAYLTIIPLNIQSELCDQNKSDRFRIEVRRVRYHESSNIENHISYLTYLEAKDILHKLYLDVRMMINDNPSYEFSSSEFGDMYMYVAYIDHSDGNSVMCGWRGLIIKIPDRAEKQV